MILRGFYFFYFKGLLSIVVKYRLCVYSKIMYLSYKKIFMFGLFVFFLFDGVVEYLRNCVVFVSSVFLVYKRFVLFLNIVVM